MPDPRFIQLPFGPGLDKETGVMVVRPNTMQDLRNVYHHEGSLVVREGTEKTNEFFDGTVGEGGTGNPATHILAGIAIRSERAGIVVSWYEPAQRVSIWRVDALGERSTFVGFWPFRSSVDGTPTQNAWLGSIDPPKVVLAEMYGQVFFAHDTYYDAQRADTYVYNPWGVLEDNLRLGPLSSDLLDEGPEVIRFRGVVRHLHYLFGWGWGTSRQPRPELLRVSLPGEPTVFDPSHYFIAGDRRDPIVACEPARQTLLVCKETETYQVIGYSRANFGIRPYDQLYGSLASRLITSVAGTVYVWSAEGPMAGTDAGPFEKVWLPLDLGGFEPATLVARTDFNEGWADYIDEVELVIFCFGRRAYVLSVRNPADPRWTYWELGKKAFCGFRLYGGEGVGGTPLSAPEINSIAYEVEGCGQYPKYIVTIDNDQQSPTDLVEVWHQPQGPFWGTNLITDRLNIDTNGDQIPDNWGVNQQSPAGIINYFWNGFDKSYGLDIQNAAAGTTAATDYLELYWTTGAVTVGTRYRFEMDAITPFVDQNTYSQSPVKLKVQYYDVGDSPVGAAQTRIVRHPEWARAFLESTAPATATYAEVSVYLDIINAGEIAAARIRNPAWREEDIAAGAWVPAGTPELASPEATQVLRPVTVAEPGMDYRIAVRYIALGSLNDSSPGYEDTSDPWLWPGVSRGTAEVPMDAPDWRLTWKPQWGVIPAWAIQFIQDSQVGPYFRMAPGCDPDGGAGSEYPKYTNRDFEVYEDGAFLGYMHRGETVWYRRLRQADLGNTFQYKMRYLGPDRDSPFGSVLSIAAGDNQYGPPDIRQLFAYLIGYIIEVNLTAERWGDFKLVGIQIQDNFDPTGAGGTLPADTWNTVWVSQIDSNSSPSTMVFPPMDYIVHGKKVLGLTLKVRVREFRESFPATQSNPEANFVPTTAGPWSEIKEVTTIPA